jgi:hypothetical protein
MEMSKWLVQLEKLLNLLNMAYLFEFVQIDKDSDEIKNFFLQNSAFDEKTKKVPYVMNKIRKLSEGLYDVVFKIYKGASYVTINPIHKIFYGQPIHDFEKSKSIFTTLWVIPPFFLYMVTQMVANRHFV